MGEQRAFQEEETEEKEHEKDERNRLSAGLSKESMGVGVGYCALTTKTVADKAT